MSIRVLLAAALLFLAAFAGAASAGDATVVKDETTGVEVTLPAADWTLRDYSKSGVLCHVWSPSESLVPRFSAMRLPRAFFPEGLRTRAKQFEELGPAPIGVADVQFAGVAAQRMEWTSKGQRAVEYGVPSREDVLVVQVAATEAEWKEPARAQELQRIFDSVRLLAVAEPVLRIDTATPAEVRAARKAQEWPRAYAVRRHDVEVWLDPPAHRLVARDTFEVEVLGEDVREVHLQCVGVIADSVRMAGRKLAVTQPDGMLSIALPAPLRRGQTVELDFAAHADDFFLSVDQKLVEEIAVSAQARAGSTYSSHAQYYPVDVVNDAPVRLSITVPDGYTAVSGGTEATASVKGPGTRTFAWRFDGRPRLLPPGFAVGRYEKVSGATRSGLLIEVHHFAGEEPAAAERLAIALRATTLYEELMGPLPWRRVAICHVRPERKEMGVSLPGLVLLSDRFFQPGADEPLRGEGIAGGQSGALMVADELAHQWNAYAAPYPNELAEGLSTYTCALVVERQAGAAEYAKGVRLCADAYIAGVEREVDVAVANPALYRSPVYRVVAFTKVNAILDVLRRRLGDKAFFAGWRAAFASAPQGRRLDYDDFRRAFETASGQDLAAFFDRWFFRPGHPRVRTHWEPASVDGRPAVRVRVTQVQPGEPFEFPLEVDVSAGGAVVAKTLDVRSREESVTWELSGPPLAVDFDPRCRMPLLRRIAR